MIVKIVATILNLILLTLITLELVKDGLSIDSSKLLFICFLAAVPTINLWHIYLSKAVPSENILTLYLKRKKLEEKTKITALQQKQSDSNQ